MAKRAISGRLKRALTENIYLKAVSLLIAIILWAIVSGERRTEWAYLVPLDITNKPHDLIITNSIPNFLDIRIQGPRSFISGLNPKEMAVHLDLSGLKEGNKVFPITPDSINAPRGARVTRINPSYITFEIEKLVRKRLNIRGDIQGKPARDYLIEDVEVIPPTMEIMGAESEMKSVKSLKTYGVDISGIKEDMEKKVHVDTFGRKIILSREEPVTVRVNIEEVSSKLELKGVRLTVINGPAGTFVSPSKVNLLLEGPKSIISSIKKEGLIATVDAEGMGPGKHKKSIEIDLPANVRILYSHPKEVTLKIAGK